MLIWFDFKVILGGGRRHWLPKVAQDPEQPTDEGRRLDGRNLIDDWIRDKKKRNIKAEYVWNNSQLDKIDAKNVDYLLGESINNYWINDKNKYTIFKYIYFIGEIRILVCGSIYVTCVAYITCVLQR